MLPVFKKYLNLIHYFRLRPFDSSTEEGRSNERHRRIALSALSGAFSQMVNYTVMIIMVPLLLKAMGKEQYGLWLAISAAGSFAVFSDLGMGYGLVNLLGKAYGQDSREKAKACVSSAYAVLLATTLLLALMGTVVLLKLDWTAFFQLQTTAAAAAARAAVAIYFICFLLNLLFGISMNIRMAFQEMYINNLFLAISKVLMLSGVLVGVVMQLSFLYFMGVLAGSQTISMVLNGAFLFIHSKPWLRPCLKHVDRSVSFVLFKSGGYFMLAAIGGMLAIQIDTLVIGRYLGANQVPTYAVPLKLFQIASTCLGFVLMPLWPAFRDALVRGDRAWVKRTFWRSFTFFYGIIGISSVLLVLVSPWVLRVWTQGQIEMTPLLRITLGIYAVASTIGPMAMLLNGANILKPQAVLSLVGGVANLTLSIFLVKRIGLVGPLWGTILTQLVFGWGGSFYYVFKLFNHRGR